MHEIAKPKNCDNREEENRPIYRSKAFLYCCVFIILKILTDYFILFYLFITVNIQIIMHILISGLKICYLFCNNFALSCVLFAQSISKLDNAYKKCRYDDIPHRFQFPVSPIFHLQQE
jgi:hypothetical protein